MLEAAVDSGINELMLLSLLFNQAERIEQYHQMKGEGLSDDEIFRALKVPSGKQKLFNRQVRKFTAGRVKSLFPELHRTDYALKSTRFSRSLMGNPMLSLLSFSIQLEESEMPV